MNNKTLMNNSGNVSKNLRVRKIKNIIWKIVFLCATIVGILFLAALLWGILSTGIKNLDWQFLTSLPSRSANKSGVKAALVGSIYILLITALVSFPLGIGTAIYLQEYAKDNKFTRFIKLNIANLAGVPSIVYGMLGLSIFAKTLMLGESVITGGLTLSLLILPVIIISTQEALKTVPDSLRQNALALGVTKWQMITGVVLPFAAPGIVTGCILAISRGVGEAAPLMVAGAVGYASFLPGSPLDQYTVLPIQIYDWASRPQKAFQDIASSGIIVLIVIMLIFNITAVIIRNKYGKRYE